ncbi:hypothetical protein NT6N_15830 [Oceaniferula spumae]|uniref:Ice-binding protein C-terminal domain-containing protein n=1 Tax=Oceaniferula spumae TaxID=2979115 RepID=A0AAT9FKS5_9BACT
MNRIKRATLSIITTTSLGIGAAQAAVVIWDNDSSNNSWQTATNWDPDGVPAFNDDITIGNGDAVTHTPASDLQINGGGSLTISGGSSWTQTTTHWTQIVDGTMTLDNGTFTRSSGGNLVLAFNANDNGVINATNSSINLGGELWFGHNLVSNTGNQVAQVTLNNSTIDANGTVGIWFWDTDATDTSMSINVIGAGSTIEARVGRRNTGGSDNTVTWETLWNEGILQYNGGNDGSFSDHFITSGTAGTVGYTLTSIPEPSSAALLGLAGLALVMRYRRYGD